MRHFTIFWFGQVVSMFGTRMTSFAIAIWAWQQTGTVTALSLLLLFSMGPAIIFGPFAGNMVDCYSRKLIIILTDTVAGLATIVVLGLFFMDSLQIWHLYVANFVAGLSGAFQMPATAASITMMVPKEQLGRANGMMSLIYSTSNVAAPLLAGALIGVLGIGGIMMIDVVTFLFAAISTALIQIPQPTSSAEMEEDQGSIWQGYTFGFRYIFQRPSLLGVQLIFFFFNLTSIFEMALRTPLILARTGENEQILGFVLSISGVGGVLGGIVMSTWGGPKKRIHGVLGGMIVAAFLGIALMGLGQSLIVWGIAAFWMVFCIPFINGSNQAIWQAKVPPALQGRVFSARRVIAQASYLIGFVVAGPLADRVFDPAMQEGGSLAVLFGGIFGVGDGAGIGLFITLCGILGVLFSASGYLIPAVRNVETLIPDHKEPK